MADVNILEYYYNKYTSNKKLNSIKQHTAEESNYSYLNTLKMKYIDQYIKIMSQYQEYWEKLIGSHYKSNYKSLNLLEEEHFLYDIMTLNQEIILYDFLALNNIKSKPHEKVVFCYKYYVNGWNSKQVLYKLRKKTLSKLFINFVNEYSKQSGLPQVVVLCYFYPLEEELNKSMKELTKLNQYFTPIDINSFLSIDRDQKKIFLKSTTDKRVNSIDKWCTRIREKIIENTVEILSGKTKQTR